MGISPLQGFGLAELVSVCLERNASTFAIAVVVCTNDLSG